MSRLRLRNLSLSSNAPPLPVPPFSLSLEESDALREESSSSIAFSGEEFRRYRVRSEVARKELEGRLRRFERKELESKGDDIESLFPSSAGGGASSSSGGGKNGPTREDMDRLSADLAEQDRQWREAYDAILKELDALKSAGAASTAATQWRTRYETAIRERDDANAKLQMAEREAAGREREAEERGRGERGMGRIDGKNGGGRGGRDQPAVESATNFAEKYQSLRDEYSLYRKEAKRILESYKSGTAGSSKDAERFAYLTAILTQYFGTPNTGVKDKMEPAIFMALELDDKAIANIKKAKSGGGWW